METSYTCSAERRYDRSEFSYPNIANYEIKCAVLFKNNKRRHKRPHSHISYNQIPKKIIL